jgi:hypothetical protein
MQLERLMLYASTAARGWLVAAALIGCLGIHPDVLPRPPSRMNSLPAVTLWAWERREDLRAIKGRPIAVAYLDQTITIAADVRSQMRRDPVIFPASQVRMPVIRIEAPREAKLSDANREAAVRSILVSAHEPGIAAVQIDFDATRSQRAFYRSLLFDVRRQMPAGLPLSITALASWCSWDGWLRDLPVDEAVPMYFRMEPDRRRAPADADGFRIREPLCMDSVGVSTTEPWPSWTASKRVYIFPDEGWQTDLPALLDRRLP